jgi:hypothetical protein
MSFVWRAKDWDEIYRWPAHPVAQWAGVVLRDRIDFGWMERKEPPVEGVSKAKPNKAWKAYKAKIMRENISAVKSAKVRMGGHAGRPGVSSHHE